MKGFIWGIIVTIAAIIVVIGIVAFTGRVNMRADISPSAIETKIAGAAMDASVERHAPKLENPIAPTEENLIAGAAVYRDHCAVCHGGPDHPESALAKALYPPPPQFFVEYPDMPDNQNFYIIEHGVRWAGMPGWKASLTATQGWQVTTFLSHMRNLSPAVAEELRKTPPAPGAEPPAPAKREGSAKRQPPSRPNPHK